MDTIKQLKISKISDIYSPSYPIQIRQLFSGRIEQIKQAMSIIPQKGLHAVVYGDRGVGKTSFSNFIKIMFEDECDVAGISCTSSDTFESLWENIFSQFYLNYEYVQKNFGYISQEEIIEGKIQVSELINGRAINVALILEILGKLNKPVIVLDEFDRLDNNIFNKKILTDLIKSISDKLPNVTIVIVGVSEDVTALVQEHQSIERNMSQIYMPMMTANEIREIILKGEGPLEIKFDEQVVRNIIKLSSGFPHFTHSLCSYSASAAIMLDSVDIKDEHLKIAIQQTIGNAHESLRNNYREATMATKVNIFREVLFAASIVDTDEYGYFQATDLEPLLASILNKPIRVNSFTFHLGKFCLLERGEILKAVGVKNRQKYKFRNPLMKAFVKLNRTNEKYLKELDLAAKELIGPSDHDLSPENF